MLILVIAGVGIVGAIAWIYWPEIIGAGWSPTPMENVRKMLEMAKVGENDTVYDLGCGDGRIIVTAACEFGAKAVGIEADPLRFLFSLIRVKLSGAGDKVKVVWGNFFNYNLTKATVITIFLSYEVNNRLKKKLQEELIPTARIVSYYWPFSGWKTTDTNRFLHLYLYQIEKI